MGAVNAEIADSLTARSLLVERAEIGIVQDVLEILGRVQESLISELAKLDPTDVGERYKAARLEKLLEATEKKIAEFYGEMKKASGEKIAQLAKIELRKLREVYGKAIGVDILSISLPSNILRQLTNESLILGGPAAQWWEKSAGDLQHNFALQMQEGLALGENLGQLKKRIAGSREMNYTDGLMSIARKNVEALIRSASQAVLNQARLELYEANPDVIKALQWRSTLDLRTSPICAALDGLTWTLEEKKPIGHEKEFRRPPAHWRCRSTIIGVVRSWDELARRPQLDLGDTKGKAREVFEERLRAKGWDQEKIDKAMMNARASLDGQVSRSMTYEQWLKTRPVEEQKEVLGVGRWELWSSGKIKMKDLINSNLRPLSLEQLEDL